MRRFKPLPNARIGSLAPRIALAMAIVLFCLGPLTAVAAPARQATDPFLTATVAPADSALYLRIPLDPAAPQWDQAGALLERAGAGELLSETGVDALAASTGDTVGLDLFLGGEAALIASDVALELFVEQAAASSLGGDLFTDQELTETGFAFAFTTPSPEFLAVGLRAAIANTARAVERPIDRTSVAGVPITSVSVPPGSGETPLAFARVGDILLVAGFPGDLVPVIEASQGVVPTLAADPDFGRAQAELPADYLAFGFSRSLLSPAVGDQLATAGLPSQLVSDETPPTAFTIAAAAAGLSLDAVVFTETAGGVAGEFPAVSALAAAPPDTLAYVAGRNLYATNIFETLVIVAFGVQAAPPAPSIPDNESTPEATPVAERSFLEEALAPYSESFGTDLVGDLLERINGDFAGWVQLGSTGGPVNALLTAGVDDSGPVQNSLSQITFRIQSTLEGDDNITSRAVGDQGNLYVADLGDQVVSQIEYGVLGEEFVLGLGSGAADIDSGASGLSDTELYRESLGSLPPPTIGALFVNLELAMPLVESASGQPLPAPDNAPAAAPPENGDADPACADFADQAAAQAAYDAFAPDSSRLDRDFDGEACEDFFAAAPAAIAEATPVASPTAIADNAALGASLPGLGFSVYEADGLVRVAGVLLVASDTETEP